MLRNGPSTTGELTQAMEGLSRFGVMQHLEVLKAAGLVLYRREGRRRLNFANPVPLREIYERWVTKPASRAAETDLHLKRYAENEVKNYMQDDGFRTVKIETELRVKAPRERVFGAFFEDYDKWWPHRYFADSRCSVDEKPGGFIYEEFKKGGGAVTGTIVYVDRPSKFIASSPSSLSRGQNAFSDLTFEDDGEGGTILKRSMEIWGNVSEETEAMFREGTRMLMEVALTGFLEDGAVYSSEGAS